MAVEAVLHPELDALELQRRRIALLVEPRDCAVVNQNPPLPQQPVGERRVLVPLRRIESQPGDMQYSLLVASYRELRPVEHRLLETQIDEQQRRPRDRKVNLRQCQQRRAVGSVDDAKVLDIESGVPPFPPSREPVELDRLSDLAREHAGDLSPIALELGKDQETDSQQQYAKKRDQREQHATGYAQDRPRQRGGGGSGRIGRCA
jgi:hypothetical protein